MRWPWRPDVEKPQFEKLNRPAPPTYRFGDSVSNLLNCTAMSDTFDAYYMWLGVPPAEQPANHYRLLGLQLFEASPDVIDNAADRQMAHVRTYQSGKHAALSQRILNEISSARLCLLDDHRKAAYDEQLRAKPNHSPAQRAVEPWTSARPAPANSPHGGEMPLAGPAVAPARFDHRPLAASTPLPHASPNAGFAAAAYLPQPAAVPMIVGQPAPPSPPPPTVQSMPQPPVAPPTSFHSMSMMPSAATVVAEASPDANEPIATLSSRASTRGRCRKRGSDLVWLLAIVATAVLLAIPLLWYLLTKNSGGADDGDKNSGPSNVVVDPSRKLNPRTTAPGAVPGSAPNAANSNSGSAAANNSGPADSNGSAAAPPANAVASAANTSGAAPPATDPNATPPLPATTVTPPAPALPFGLLPEKHALPTADQRKRADQELKKLFGAELASAATYQQKFNLAQTLLSQADNLKEDPAARYVALHEAYDLAIASGAYLLAQQAIDQLAAGYEEDELTLRVDLLIDVSKTSRNAVDRRAVAVAALNLVGSAVNAGRFDEANTLARMAEGLASDLGDSPLRIQARMIGNQVKRRERTWSDIDAARKTLEGDSNDPRANLTCGQHACLIDGDWRQGLPMLAKCSDAKLKAAAEADLAEPTDPDARIAIANAWYDVAGSDESLAAFHARAHYWYEQALPSVTGLTKAKVEKRLADIANVPAAQALIAKGKLAAPTLGTRP